MSQDDDHSLARNSDELHMDTVEATATQTATAIPAEVALAVAIAEVVVVDTGEAPVVTGCRISEPTCRNKSGVGVLSDP